jgi:hypothetical protein
MCKVVLIGLILALVLLMVVAAVVVQEYGWTGFLIFLAAMVVLVYLAKKMIPRLLRYMITRPMRSMGKALEGSRIVVHSVTPAEPPPREEWEGIDDEHGPENEMDDDDEGEHLDYEQPWANPSSLDWYSAEFSVIPRDAGPCEGRMVNRHGWNPGMISAVVRAPNLRSSDPFRGWSTSDDWNDQTIVQSADVEIWDNGEYVAPNDTVFNEQRLRLRIGVSRTVTAAVLVYFHFTQIGTISIPRIDIRPEGPS